MSYVFDNSPLSSLFKNYYRRRFPSLWEKFDGLVQEGRLVSVREVLRELEVGAVESLRIWAADHTDLFATASPEEAAFITRIYGVEHFQQNIETQKILKGGRNADAFVIARAAVEGRAVVTLEQLRPNAVKIPNICERFGVRCMSLEEFMETEGWEF